LGTQYGDDGVQLRWLATTDRFVEFGLELGRGRSFPGGDNPRNGAGMVALTAHIGDDIGDSHSWRAGLSVLNAKAQADFTQRWQAAMTRWAARAAPLRGQAVVSQHKAFVYLYDWLGLKEVAVL
jgi:hypothetical protein